MRFQRPVRCHVIAAGMVLVTLAAPVHAKSDFPVKAMRLVVPGSGQIDALARVLGAGLSERLGQPVVIHNVLGAGGILAAHSVAQGSADGHSLLLATTGFAISAALHSSLPYDPRRDFVGVAQIAIPTTVLVASPALGVKSVGELVAMAGARPRKLLFGSPGPGSGQHLAGEKFRLASGIDIVHVGLRSGQMLIETMTGRVHYCFLPLGSALPLIHDGKLVALAVATPQRSPLLPEVPAMAEMLPEFTRPIGSFGLLAPVKTPHTVVSRIGRDVVQLLAATEVQEWMRSGGLLPSVIVGHEYDRVLHAQIDAFAELIRATGIPKR